MLLSLPSGFNIGSLHIQFYGLLIASGMAIGVIIACLNAKKRGLNSNDILVLACYVLPFAVIGTRLAYVLFNLEKYTNFWDVFKIWEGGMAIYGGIVGGALGVICYCLIHKKNIFATADIVMPSVILGQAIGRWGNFFNQEAYGYPITDPNWQWFPFGVYIDHCTQEMCTCGGLGHWHMATFFYEFLCNIIIFAILMILLRKLNIKENGVVMASYFVLYGSARAGIESLRTDPLMLGSVRAAQLFSGIIIVLGVAFIVTTYVLKYIKIKKSKAAVIVPAENNGTQLIKEEKSKTQKQTTKKVESKKNKTKKRNVKKE